MKDSRSLLFLVKKILLTCIYLVSCSTVFSVNYTAYRTETPPVIDGIGDESCWINAVWSPINQPIDGKSLPDSTDFYGRYKVTWDASRVYILMEITDDKLNDFRVNPKDNYWQDDCAEFFIDEDNTPQGHECGATAYNAFAYHIAAVARDKASYTNGKIVAHDAPNAIQHVIDLGEDCDTWKALNLDDHVMVKISKNGNKNTWELEFKIYDKNYNQQSNDNTPVTLVPNKTLGFAIAYCDDDSGERDNMIGTVPDHNDYSGPYPFYRFTNEFGTITLNDSVLVSSTALHRTIITDNILMWPNPVNNILQVRSDHTVQQFDKIEILNLSGAVVLSRKFEHNYAAIDVSSYPSGVYTAQISNEKYIYKQLIIIL
ncbi:MAG: sugar-binding protein [Paludibacter sp.]|nr:sugar-binding protein [Paludibacter sp.]